MAQNKKQKDEDVIKLPPKPNQEGKAEQEGQPKEAEVIEELPSSNNHQNEEPKTNEDWITRLIEAVIPLADKYLTYRDNEAKAKKSILKECLTKSENGLYSGLVFGNYNCPYEWTNLCQAGKW